eukprot:scaffold166163_cov43-Tisochrysis_lutea.AAC.3
MISPLPSKAHKVLRASHISPYKAVLRVAAHGINARREAFNQHSAPLTMWKSVQSSPLNMWKSVQSQSSPPTMWKSLQSSIGQSSELRAAGDDN